MDSVWGIILGLVVTFIVAFILGFAVGRSSVEDNCFYYGKAVIGDTILKCEVIK